MKRLQKTLMLLSVFCLLMSSMASAELRRGDSGDLVHQIQQVLKDGGFLADEPDGVFGKRTEQAVIAFQQTYDYEANGVLDDEQINYLLRDPSDLPDEFYTDGAGADGRGVESYCYSETRSTGYSYETKTTYCEEHSWIVATADAILNNGEAKEAADMYEEEVMRLYTEMWQRLPNDDAGDYIKTAISSFNHMISGQIELLELWYASDEPQLFQQKRAELMRTQMIFLCGIVNIED